MSITDKAWTCDIKIKGCTTKAVASWVCSVEGVQISACRNCYDDWRERAGKDPNLALHCPRCEKKPDRVAAANRAAAQSAAGSVTPISGPLTGIIAEALDAAMFREGILGDKRERILSRLAVEEPWLNSAPTQQAAS